MSNSEFSALIQQARTVLNQLSKCIRSRQHRRELCSLSRIIDELEKLNSKDPPKDWGSTINVLVTVVELARKLFITIRT